MYILYAIFLSLFVITLFFAAIRKSSKNIKDEKTLKELEKNRPTYNQFRVLPYDVKPLQVQHSKTGKIRLVLTPTHFQQLEESVYSIPVKAKYGDGEIGFELSLDTELPKFDDFEFEAGEGMLIFRLELNTVLADNFLKVLANLYEVELSSKAQIVKELFLVTEEEKINTETLFAGQAFDLFFADKEPGKINPNIRLHINLTKGEIIFEELDPMFRPIIIDRLTFKPNIRS